jgi:hypothetical protein
LIHADSRSEGGLTPNYTWPLDFNSFTPSVTDGDVEIVTVSGHMTAGDVERTKAPYPALKVAIEPFPVVYL